VIGGAQFDLDPASHPTAQLRVGAKHFYTKAIDGLARKHPWFGVMWLNPPYGRGDQAAKMWIQRLLGELEAGNVSEAFVCLNSDSMSSNWFEPLWSRSQGLVLMRGRPNYYNPSDSSSSPIKGTVMIYFGHRRHRFFEEYGKAGYVLLPDHEARSVARMVFATAA
jgi:hypothetical protein